MTNIKELPGANRASFSAIADLLKLQQSRLNTAASTVREPSTIALLRQQSKRVSDAMAELSQPHVRLLTPTTTQDNEKRPGIILPGKEIFPNRDTRP